MLMEDDTGERIEFADPGHARQDRFRMGVACAPALLDAAGGEVDVLGVGLAVKLRSQQTHDMHPGLTTVA